MQVSQDVRYKQRLRLVKLKLTDWRACNDFAAKWSISNESATP
jgi:hypothetical protein